MILSRIGTFPIISRKIKILLLKHTQVSKYYLQLPSEDKLPNKNCLSIAYLPTYGKDCNIAAMSMSY